MALEMATESPEVKGEYRRCGGVTALGWASKYEKPTSLPQAASSASQKQPVSLGTHPTWCQGNTFFPSTPPTVVFTLPGELIDQDLPVPLPTATAG